jgi:hypothetical protein
MVRLQVNTRKKRKKYKSKIQKKKNNNNNNKILNKSIGEYLDGRAYRQHCIGRNAELGQVLLRIQSLVSEMA